jgi:hypothetical protein
MVSVSGCGTSSRSSPPERRSAAAAHHFASAGPCSVAWPTSAANDRASPSNPSYVNELVDVDFVVHIK